MIMPVIFVGHGSPMNAVEENEFSAAWRNIGQKIPKPQMILCISAHWETNGVAVTSSARPETIHDFYGFPPELYRVQYPAPGSPSLASMVRKNVDGGTISEDPARGLDHGCWSVLIKMFPEADIPVVQLSLDTSQPLMRHFNRGEELAFLRREGVLILGSGNIVHNLGILDWHMTSGGYDWAEEMNNRIRGWIADGNTTALTDISALGTGGRLAVPTMEHYLPMLYCAALRGENETISFFNDIVVLGSISMTSFIVRRE